MKTLLRELFSEDQKERRKVFGIDGTKRENKKDLQQLVKNDKRRIAIVLSLFKQNRIKAKQDFYYAAMILQHGTKLHHYKLANRFSLISMNMGYKPAKWLYAASLDRYLKSIGEPQKFGTQFYMPKGSKKWKIYPFDKKTTDKERKKYNVPVLKKLLEFGTKLNS